MKLSDFDIPIDQLLIDIREIMQEMKEEEEGKIKVIEMVDE